LHSCPPTRAGGAHGTADRDSDFSRWRAPSQPVNDRLTALS
jgi:hypothetical protein